MIDVGKQLANDKHRPAVGEDLGRPCNWAILSVRDLQLKHESTYFGAGRSSPPNNPYGRGDIDPDATKPGLQGEITVDDPAVFTTPWSGLMTYRHVQGEWPEAVCAENTQGSGSSWIVLVPQADKPDF